MEANSRKHVTTCLFSIWQWPALKYLMYVFPKDKLQTVHVGESPPESDEVSNEQCSKVHSV